MVAVPFAFASIALLVGGVRLDELMRFAGYELLFAGLPGILALRALGGIPGSFLRQVVIGWPLGYALLIAAFIVTASLDIRWALWLHPLVVGGIAGLVLWRRKRPDGPGFPFPETTVRWSWVVGGVVVLVLAQLCIETFLRMPLPRDITAGTHYQTDLFLNVSFVNDALGHWPVKQAWVAGTDSGYHLFAHFHMASLSQITDIDPVTIQFRLFFIPLLALVTLQMVYLGSAVSRMTWAGPIAALLLLQVGEIDLLPRDPVVFAGLTAYLPWSHGPHVLSLVFGGAVLIMFTEQIGWSVRDLPRPGWGAVAVTVLLLAATAGSRAIVPPVLIGGLVLFAALEFVRRRGIDWRAVAYAFVAILSFYAAYALMIKATGEGGLEFDLFRTFEDTVSYKGLSFLFGDSSLGNALALNLGSAIALVGLLGPALVGAIWLFRRGELTPAHRLLACIVLVGIAPGIVMYHPGTSHLSFVYQGVIAGCILAAEGLLIAFAAARDRLGTDALRRLALITGSWVAGTALIAGSAAYLKGDLVIPVYSRLSPILDPLVEDRAGRDLLFVILLGLGGTALAALRLPALARRRPRAPLYAAPALVMGLLWLGLADRPLDYIPFYAERIANDEPVRERRDRELTPGLYEGLRWVQKNTPTDETLAVDNHWIDDEESDATVFFYSAISQRRVYLESWVFSTGAFTGGRTFSGVNSGRQQPYPERFANNQAAFQGDREALERLRRSGVGYLIDDLAANGASGLAGELPVVFRNEDVTVYRLGKDTGAPA